MRTILDNLVRGAVCCISVTVNHLLSVIHIVPSGSDFIDHTDRAGSRLKSIDQPVGGSRDPSDKLA